MRCSISARKAIIMATTATRKQKQVRNSVANRKLKLQGTIRKILKNEIDCSYEPTAIMYALGGDDLKSRGHQWSVDIPATDGNCETNEFLHWWLDDRDGDVMELLADSLRERAKILNQFAKELTAKGGAA
jgi:hypothetical protein